MDVPKFVEIQSLEDLPLGVLNPNTGITKTATAIIRSNHYSWTLSAYAQRGALTVFDGLVYDITTDTVPYILAFNSADPVTAQKFTSTSPLPTTVELALTATFSRKTTGGKTGEPFVYSITVAPEEGAANWDAGNYRDVIYITVTAN